MILSTRALLRLLGAFASLLEVGEGLLDLSMVVLQDDDRVGRGGPGGA
jgi:hypothetical protein